MKKKRVVKKSNEKKSSTKKKKGPLHLLWVIDPWETLDHAQDTTLRLAEEAMAKGARCYLAENRTISLIDGAPQARVSEITRIVSPRTSNLVFRSDAVLHPLSEFDHLFYRTDPPVDLSYLLPLQLASFGARGKKKGRYPKIHSSADSLFFLNEKWGMASLMEFFPKSVVSASCEELTAFACAEKKTVLKPLYLAQSKGVKTLSIETFSEGGGPSGNSLKRLLAEATQGWKIPVIVQEFLPGILKGETRLWFAGGKLITSVHKVPKSGEAIIDMDRGGTLARAKLSAKELRASRAIGSLLQKEKILFAAVDLIDGKITDFNHTSPGLLVQMEKLLGENLAKKALAPIL